ncbi:MAG: tetratricopeptide repeat protein [Planctomycetota bacterium]
MTSCTLFSDRPVPTCERLSPRGADLWERARAARLAGDLEKSQALLRLLMVEQPHFFRGVREWQEVMDAVGRGGEVERSLRDHPEASASGLTLRARVESDPLHARQLLEMALARDPEFVWAHLGLAFLCRKAGDLQGARNHLEQALGLHPEFPEALRDLAEVAYESGEPREACAHLEHYLSLEPADREARHFLASLLATVLLDYGEAEEQYRTLVRENPTDVTALLGLAGVVALHGSEVEEAVLLYERVLELDPRAMEATYNLGWLYETRLGDPRKALHYYESFLQFSGPAPDPRPVLYVVFFVPNRVEALKRGLAREAVP